MTLNGIITLRYWADDDFAKKHCGDDEGEHIAAGYAGLDKGLLQHDSRRDAYSPTAKGSRKLELLRKGAQAAADHRDR